MVKSWSRPFQRAGILRASQRARLSPKEEASREPQRVPRAEDGKLAMGLTADSSLENFTPQVLGLII